MVGGCGEKGGRTRKSIHQNNRNPTPRNYHVLALTPDLPYTINMAGWDSCNILVIPPGNILFPANKRVSPALPPLRPIGLVRVFRES